MRHLFEPLLSPSQIMDNPEDLAHYGKDWCKNFLGIPRLILLPVNTSEVQAILRLCHEQEIKVVPSGGRTGLSGGATATQGEVVLSLERMNRVISVDPLEQSIRVEAGVTLDRIHQEAKSAGLYYPVEFGAKGSCQIGGNIATNAGGIRVLRYGTTRQSVLGLTAVTGSGALLNLNKALIKDNTGYDFRNLIVGSEGTLAVITEATLALTRQPSQQLRLIGAVKDLTTALQALQRIRTALSNLSVFEYFTEAGMAKVLAHHTASRPFHSPYPSYVLIELETEESEMTEATENFFAKLLEEEIFCDLALSQSHRQAEEFMAIREAIGETLSTHYVPHKNDISLPLGNMPIFVDELQALLSFEYPGWETVIFGHLGDGNLHINILKPETTCIEAFHAACAKVDEKLFALVQKHQGSISAEHGVGLLKKPYLHFSRSPLELQMMREIKKVFDPKGILNPGKIF